MIITRKNLQQFIDLQNVTNNQIIDGLTQIGLEAEINQDFLAIDKQIIVVEIIEKKRHPHSDKNWICKGKLNDEQFVNIVCGASNFEVNDKVVLAQVGTKLAHWKKKIKKVNFYGIISQGMFCAWDEIKIKNYFNQPNDGIIVLPKEAIINTSPLSYVGLDDVLFDISSPWDRKEFESSYVLAKYLKKILNVAWIEKEFLINCNQNIESVKSEENKNICAFWSNDQILLSQTPLKIKSSLLISEQKVTNIFLEDIVTYTNLLFNTNLKIKKEDKQYFLFNQDNKLSFLEGKAFQKIVKILIEKDQKIKITLFKTYKKQDQKSITLSLSYINKKIGFNLNCQEIIDLFKDSDFDLFENQKKQEITFDIPLFLNIKEDKEQAMLAEIIRFYDQNKINPMPLNIKSDQINFNNNISWKTMEQKIANYLLSLGINQTQNFVILKKNDQKVENTTKKYLNLKFQRLPNQENIKCKKKNKNIILLDKTFDQLSEKVQKYQKNYFTIVPSFSKIDNFLIEEKHLEICFQQKWLDNQFEQEKISIGANFITVIIRNIFTLFNLPTNNLISLFFNNDNKEKITKFDDLIEQKNIDQYFNFLTFWKFIDHQTLKNENYINISQEKNIKNLDLERQIQKTNIAQFFQFFKFKEGNKHQPFFGVKLNLNAIFILLQKQRQIKISEEKEINDQFFDFTFCDQNIDHFLNFCVDNKENETQKQQFHIMCQKKIHFWEILSSIKLKNQKIKKIKLISDHQKIDHKTNKILWQTLTFRFFFKSNEQIDAQKTFLLLKTEIEKVKKKYNLQ